MNENQPSTFEATILVVDDRESTLDLLDELLTQAGYHVLLVSEGIQTIFTARAHAPDLILLDIMMSDMNGYEVCQQLKADALTREIPVIFISARDEIFDKLQAFSLGAVDYISKPFEMKEVLARVRNQLAVRGAKALLQEQNTKLHQEINEHKQTAALLQHRNRELFVLNEIGQMFSSSLELDQVLATALQEVQRLLDVVSTSVWLLIPETGELECQQIIGPGTEHLIHARLPAGQGISGWVAQHGESVLSANILNDPRHHNPAGGNDNSAVRSMVSVPLKIKGNVIGVLNLADPHVDCFTEENLRFVEPIASAAAIAIENARLYTTAQQEIAERKRAEAELRDANASKDKFFSIISHDLRSPFNAVLGYMQLMFEDFETYEPEQLKQNIEHVYKSAERLYALLENLLTWSRIQRGAMKCKPEEFDLQEIAENNIDLFFSKAEQKRVLLKTSVQEGMGVYADYNMVNTVIRNLVSNALKFTSTDGIIEISAQNRNDHFEISVSDTGAGIPAEDLAKLFRIDVQYTNLGIDGEKGTGLGLILCQDLVEKNGGRIWVESEVAKGTTFRFTLPTKKK